MNITHLFFEQVARNGGTTAFIEDGRSITFDELADEVRRKAAYLMAREIRPGDNVLVLVPMSLELYRTLIALFHIGATAVFVDAWAGADRIDMAAKRIPIAAFIGSAKAHLLRFRSPALRAVPLKMVAGWGRWRRTEPTPLPPATPDPEAAALVTFTTGSTGVPKGAVRTHRFLAVQHRELTLHTALEPGSVDLATLPIFPLSNLASGVTTLLAPIDPRRPDRFDARRIAETMKRQHVTSTVASPAFFEKLCRYLVESRVSLDEFERGFVGGAAVYPETAELMRRAFPGASLTILYGATEVEPISAIEVDELLATDSDERGLAVGRPVDSLDLRILRLEPGCAYEAMSGKELEALGAEIGEAGEIVVSGEHVLRSYIGAEDGRGSCLSVDGLPWHRTGDAGYLTTDGRLFLLGRISRRVKQSSGWIYPVEFERRIAALGTVGTLLSIDGKIVAAIEKRGDIEELKRGVVHSGLPHDRIEVLEEIPRDPRHRSKIDYEKLARAIVGS